MPSEIEEASERSGRTGLVVVPPSGTGDVPITGDRRSRKRAARRDHLLELAAELVERDGLDALTMAALADAADYAPASLYTYFPSRGALVAALQGRALANLAAVAESAVAAWDADLASGSTDAVIGGLARLWAFSDLFLAAPTEHARDFQLQQQLLVTAGAESVEDAASVVPAAMAVLEVPRRLISEAVDAKALAPDDDAVDPVHELVDRSLIRTLSWVVSLNGALLTERLSTGLPSTGVALGTETTGALLRGWGADRVATADARRLADRWRSRGGNS